MKLGLQLVSRLTREEREQVVVIDDDHAAGGLLVSEIRVRCNDARNRLGPPTSQVPPVNP